MRDTGNKYQNRTTVRDGKSFDSKKEAERYQELRFLQQANLIRNLRCQVPFDMTVNGRRVCRYIADFVYEDVETSSTIVEDVKGYRKGCAYQTFRIKARLLEACYGLTVQEV